MVNENIRPRALTPQEKADRAAGIYDSFANYLVFCPRCGRLIKTNAYIMRAEAYIVEAGARGKKCPGCGGNEFVLGYPENSKTGFVKFK